LYLSLGELNWLAAYSIHIKEELNWLEPRSPALVITRWLTRGDWQAEIMTTRPRKIACWWRGGPLHLMSIVPGAGGDREEYWVLCLLMVQGSLGHRWKSACSHCDPTGGFEVELAVAGEIIGCLYRLTELFTNRLENSPRRPYLGASFVNVELGM